MLLVVCLLPATVQADSGTNLTLRYGTDGVLTVTLPTTTGSYTYGTTNGTGTLVTQTAADVTTLPDAGWNWAVQKAATTVGGTTYDYVLTLNNFHSDTTGWTIIGISGNCIESALMNLYIVLHGTNTLATPDARGTSIITETSGNKFLITGDGTLNASGCLGIAAKGGLTVSGGKINANGAIYGLGSSNGSVTITGGTVKANGGTKNDSNGIRCSTIIISGGTVTAKSACYSGAKSALSSAPTLTGYTGGYQWRTSDSGAYTPSTTDVYPYSYAHAYVEIQPLPVAKYSYNTPAAIVQNGVTATVTYSLPSPQEAATSITATVTLTGTATAMGTHTVNLTSTKANLTATAQTATVTAGQDLTTTPITKTFTFTVPAKDADDLTLTHTFAPTLPTITSPKANKTVTVAVGSTKTLSVTAQNATSYQWYVNRNDGAGFGTIAGATNASYTTAAVSKADDGYKYYCIATNANGSTTSAIFTLKASIVPATGDNSALWLWTSLAVLSQTGLAAAYLYRNKKKCRA